jgi:4-hydroxy-tetrahydrodipicolinate synthase
MTLRRVWEPDGSYLTISRRTYVKLSEDASGVFVISVTPFDEDGRVDDASTDSLVDFYLTEGVHGITVLGVMGEAPKLTADEQLAFALRVIDRVDGRVPVIVGVSNPGMDNLVALSQKVTDAGAAGVMIAGIPGLKTDEQVYGYFGSVIGRLGDIPVCLQDYPPSTTVWMSTSVVNRLIDDFSSLVMFKHEDCPGHRKLTALRRAPDDGHRRVSIVVGNGGLYVPQELARGADGVMTGLAFPQTLVEVYDMFAAGNAEAAEDLYDAHLPLIRHEQQIGFGLAIRKEVLRRRGAIACGLARAPGPSMDADDITELDGLIRRLGRRLAEMGRMLPPGL